MDSGRYLPSRRAQSSVIGIVLIIGLTLAAASAVVVFGSEALDDGQHRSQIGQAEQAMTQFDSRAAQVALGDSDVQTVSIGGVNGNYYVDEDAGSVKVYHQNWTGSGDNETVLEEKSLGALVYENGDTKIAYQGGGVWRSDTAGSSTMVSSPEFHYRQATLTFPIVRVEGSGAASGNVRAHVSNKDRSRNVFPNSSSTYDGSSKKYLNPIQKGNMTVEVESEYCDAWRTYFRHRTDGEVSDCDDGTVTAQLLSLGTQGDFDLAMGSRLTVRGQSETEPLEDFELHFESDSNSGFNNFEWTLHSTDDGDRQFEVFIHAANGDGDGKRVYMHVYYSEDGGDTYQSWVLAEDDSEPFELSGEKENATLTVDLVDASRDITYEDFGTYSFREGPEYKSDGAFVNDETIDGTDYSDGSNEDLETVMQYYFGKSGDMDMTTDELHNGNAGLDDGSSTGTITYAGDGRVVTFLHITENRVEVELD